jgi:protein-S-isoprenylcysteine O-methyltransferase Ste14
MNGLYFKIVAFVLAVIIYFIRRPYTRKSFDTRQLIKCIAITILVVLFFTSWFDFAKMHFPFVVRLIGLALIVFGSWLLCVSHKVLGGNWSPCLNLKKSNPKKLVTKGPYRYIRHPIYSTSFILIIGFWLFIDNWFFGGLPLIYQLILYSTNINKEEQILIKRFGQKYQNYMKKTGRLFPKF